MEIGFVAKESGRKYDFFAVYDEPLNGRCRSYENLLPISGIPNRVSKSCLDVGFGRNGQFRFGDGCVG